MMLVFLQAWARSLLMSTLMLACALPARSLAQASDDLEAKVKAGFLLNFVRYVEWPGLTSSNRPVVIGVLGQDTLGRSLDSTLEGKNVETRTVQAKRARRISELSDCHVLFVCPSERDRLRGILAATRNKPVLTVSDMDGFTSAGGMIMLKRSRQGTMRFEINREAAEAAGLKISSKLLKLADNYRPE